MKRRRVVITGLGVVAPNGVGINAFWDSLIGGQSGIDQITAFDASAYPCQIAGEVRDFNARDFTSARSARTMGRFSQFAVAATRLAFEDARIEITPELRTKSMICLGNSVNGGGDVVEDAMKGLLARGVEGIKPWSALEYPAHAPSSYVAIEFGINGPAISVSTNCCTGLDALHTAASYIADGRAVVAVAGGTDAPIFPLPFGAFCALGALSKRNQDPKRASRPYDALRDGLVISEGAGSLVLEDLDFAQDRGADIYAEVLGYGAGSEAIGMRKGDLSGAVMSQAIQTALSSAGLKPRDLDHINAHGSSLQDYDVCDVNAFKAALGEHAYRLPIASIKSMIGQPVSAAGALQTAAACMSIRSQWVPPTINQEVQDPQCDLDFVPNRGRPARVNRVLVNGHSFGGSVSALVVGRVAAARYEPAWR